MMPSALRTEVILGTRRLVVYIIWKVRIPTIGFSDILTLPGNLERLSTDANFNVIFVHADAQSPAE